jgi:hypothetical protein
VLRFYVLMMSFVFFIVLLCRYDGHHGASSH